MGCGLIPAASPSIMCSASNWPVTIKREKEVLRWKVSGPWWKTNRKSRLPRILGYASTPRDDGWSILPTTMMGSICSLPVIWHRTKENANWRGCTLFCDVGRIPIPRFPRPGTMVVRADTFSLLRWEACGPPMNSHTLLPVSDGRWIIFSLGAITQ